MIFVTLAHCLSKELFNEKEKFVFNVESYIARNIVAYIFNFFFYREYKLN